MSFGHTWREDHPHAQDRQWTEYGMWGDRVWSWAACATCGARTAVSAGAGRPICDECFDAMLARTGRQA